MSWPLSVKQAAKITFAQSKNRTLQSIIYSPEKKKKRIGTSSILAWGKSGVDFSTASKSCPDDQFRNRWIGASLFLLLSCVFFLSFYDIVEA